MNADNAAGVNQRAPMDASYWIVLFLLEFGSTRYKQTCGRKNSCGYITIALGATATQLGLIDSLGMGIAGLVDGSKLFMDVPAFP